MIVVQSYNGAWTECLTEGDIDYEKIALLLWLGPLKGNRETSLSCMAYRPWRPSFILRESLVSPANRTWR